eukprot:Ihof_evm3s591 gene=Ihof_evmTU3s591
MANFFKGKEKAVKKLDISSPVNFAHCVHVGFDPDSNEFTGLPAEWKVLLESSTITKEERAKDPQALLDVLGFVVDGMGSDKYMTKEDDDEPEESKKHMLPRPPQVSAPPKRAPPPILARPESTMNRMTRDLSTLEIRANQDKVGISAKKLPPSATKTVEAPTTRKKPRKMTDEEIMTRLKAIVNDGNPKDLYTNFKKIGQGASGVVYTATEICTGNT